jgi:Hemerythrin HHE cation binding domain
MARTIAFEDAVDLLDADHKAVKKMFIDYAALCDDAGPAEAKGALAARICAALKVHTRIEEEIFYPAVRKATGDDALIAEALHEHADAKQAIAALEGLEPGSAEHDAAVQALAKAIDEHVLEEREQVFLEARRSAADLKSLAVVLFDRKKALTAQSSKSAARELA